MMATGLYRSTLPGLLQARSLGSTVEAVCVYCCGDCPEDYVCDECESFICESCESNRYNGRYLCEDCREGGAV